VKAKHGGTRERERMRSFTQQLSLCRWRVIFHFALSSAYTGKQATLLVTTKYPIFGHNNM